MAAAAALALGLASCAPTAASPSASLKVLTLASGCELTVVSGGLNLPGVSVSGLGLQTVGCDAEYRVSGAQGTNTLSAKTWVILPKASTIEARVFGGEWQQVYP